jgi:hypothetical protein
MRQQIILFNNIKMLFADLQINQRGWLFRKSAKSKK